MKSFVKIALIGILILSFSLPTYADDPVKKLGRGVANILTCPFELTKCMGDTKGEKGIFAGYTWGVFSGTLNIVKRALVGVYEVITFPFPIPKDYKPILTDPEFFMEDYLTGNLAHTNS